MSRRNSLVLVGGGGHCRSCIDVIESAGAWQIVGILDVPGMVGARVFDYEIAGTDPDISRFAEAGAGFLVTVGQIKNAEIRKRIYRAIHATGGSLPTIISPLAYVSPRAKVGSGTIIMHRAIVNSGAVIGNNVIVNTMALVEHDAHVGDHCHVSTASVINGDVNVGEGCFVGSNAVLHHGAKVADGTVIPAGSVYRSDK